MEPLDVTPAGPPDHERDDPAEPTASVAPRPRKVHTVTSWAMIAAGVVILAASAWVGWRSYQAYTHLSNASADVSELQGQLRSVGAVAPAATASTVAHLQEESSAARSAAEDPLFGAATKLPWLGPNLIAVREVTLTVDKLATEVMPPLADVARSLQPADLASSGGTIDLAPIEKASGALQGADEAVVASRAAIDRIDRSELVAPVGEAVLTMSNKLAAAALVTATGARATRLIPPMLGAGAPRDYLVVCQNLAEPRATGGIFGSFAVIHVDKGKITVVDKGTPTRTLGVFDPPVAQLSADQRALYTNRPVIFPADVNLTPDFAVAARLFAKMYTERSGRPVDGLLAIDPVALSYLMKGAGPVDAGDGVVLTSDNVVSALLSTAYQQFDAGPDQAPRDAFLARAAAAAFTAVSNGSGNAQKTMDGLSRAASEHRLLLWSADPEEQHDLTATQLGGQMPQAPGTPTVGVFLNDGTGGKMGYYLQNKVAVAVGDCAPDGRRTLTVTVSMHSTAPKSGLPAYVTGPRELVEPYSVQTNVSVVAPVGGQVDHAVIDGVVTGIPIGREGVLEVGTVTSVLAPGATTELVFTMLGPAAGQAALTPEMVLTPGVNPWIQSVAAYEPCLSRSGSSGS